MLNYPHPEIHTDRGRALILGQPRFVRKAEEETALSDGGVADEQELHVDRFCHVVVL
jgi:hypothetical protein